LTTKTPLLKVNSLVKHYDGGSSAFIKRATVKAVDRVSFEMARAETLAVIGESGCGKSTVARLIVRLLDSSGGEIWFDGQRIDNLPAATFRPIRKRMQIIFQDPYASLNPRMKVRDILAEPLVSLRVTDHGPELEHRLDELMDIVHLPKAALARYPHEFSGGQRQRICIARALATKPDLIVCDEAVSALDVSVKAQIVNLLQELQRSMGLAMLFISHDLAIVSHMTHRVAVMYLGKIVEIATRQEIFSNPNHPYTQALLSAIPSPDPRAPRSQVILRGDIPSAVNPPNGCRFNTRCPHAFDRCRIEEPPLTIKSGERQVACHLSEAPEFEL
jgi:peptide/nickel transport system ATP-binding protein